MYWSVLFENLRCRNLPCNARQAFGASLTKPPGTFFTSPVHKILANSEVVLYELLRCSGEYSVDSVRIA